MKFDSLRFLVFNPMENEKEFFKAAAQDFSVSLDFYPAKLNHDTVSAAAGYDVVISQPGPMDELMIRTLKEGGVRLMQTMSVGMDHIDFEAAKKYDLAFNPAEYSPQTVAEFSVMMMLMALRKARALLERFAVQDYRIAAYRGCELKNRVVGIYGTGRIGMCTARIVKGFGAQVYAYSPSRVPGTSEDGIVFVSFDKLIETCDLLSLHAAVTPQNRRVFNRELFSRMKEGSILVNTARGELIDTSALIEALESSKLQAAALDVVENDRGIYFVDHQLEALGRHDLAILKSMPQVCCFPHVAYYTQEAAYDYCYGSVKRALDYLKEHELMVY